MVLGGIMCALICHPETFRQGVCECFYTGEVYVHGNLTYLRSAECRLFNVQDISTMLWWEVLVILVASNIVIGFITFFLKRSVLGFCMRTVFLKNVYFDLRLLKFIFEVLRQHWIFHIQTFRDKIEYFCSWNTKTLKSNKRNEKSQITLFIVKKELSTCTIRNLWKIKKGERLKRMV